MDINFLGNQFIYFLSFINSFLNIFIRYINHNNSLRIDFIKWNFARVLSTCKSTLSFHINVFSIRYNAAILVRRVAMFVMSCTDVNRLSSSLMSLSLDANKELLQKGDCRLLRLRREMYLRRQGTKTLGVKLVFERIETSRFLNVMKTYFFEN